MSVKPTFSQESSIVGIAHGSDEISCDSREESEMFSCEVARKESESSISEEATQVRITSTQSLTLPAQLLDLVLAMKLTRPDILRVTPAYCALRAGAIAFQSASNVDLHQQSFVSHRIRRFWSHSWHGDRFKKYLTVLVLYKGTPAIFVGSFMALLPMVLFPLLPDMPGIAGFADMRFSPWSVCIGVTFTILMFLLWKPHQQVFFDQICINQKDRRLKMEAILSLSGLLKRSEEMFVLWDSTWTQRLWCLFELAAFMKSKDSSGSVQILTIRPTFIGPCMTVIFLMSFLAVLPLVFLRGENMDLMMLTAGAILLACVLPALVASMAFRSYFRSVDVLEDQLRTANLDEARCSCCDCGHVSQDGQSMICDRVVVKECIKIWFGNQEAFETCLHSEVLDTLSSKLRYGFFTKKYCLAMTMPILWAFMDISASWAAHAWWDFSVEWLLAGLTVWFIWIPLTFEWFVYLAHQHRQKASTCCRDLLRSIMVILLAAPMIVILAAIFVGHAVLVSKLWELYGPHHRYLASLDLAFAVLFAAALLGLLFQAMPAARFSRGPRESHGETTES